MSDKVLEKQFVSRGGLKLQAALEEFDLDVTDLTVLDVGCSTGGFVDCLLQRGAAKVYALDTAYGELAWKLRNDPRVVVMERTNILHLPSFPEKVDLITIDAGWTKLVLILPIVRQFLKKTGTIIALLKPHYETSKSNLVRGVVIAEKLEEIKQQVLAQIEQNGFIVEKVIDSPILGGGGNREFLCLLKPRQPIDL